MDISSLLTTGIIVFLGVIDGGGDVWWGCSGSSGSASNQLSYPQMMYFDVDGNLLVLDTYNSRVQQFLLRMNSSCSCKWKRKDEERIDLCCLSSLDPTSMTTHETTRLIRKDDESSMPTIATTQTVQTTLVNECKAG